MCPIVANDLQLLNVIAVIVLLAMMFFVATDVFRRYVLNSPMANSYEVVEFMMAFVFVFGIAYMQRHKGHVVVSLVVSRLKERTQAVIDSVVYFISLGLFCVITWQAFARARFVWLGGDVSFGTMGPLGKVPVAPFYYVVALACAALCLVFLVDLFNSLAKAVTK